MTPRLRPLRRQGPVPDERPAGFLGPVVSSLRPYRRRLVALVFAALAFAGLALAKFPLLIVVLALVPLSIALARPEPVAVR